MAAEADLLLIRAKLEGAAKVIADAQAMAGAIEETGAAAKTAGAEAASGAAGFKAQQAAAASGFAAFRSGISSNLSSLQTMGKRMQSAGRGMTYAFTLPLVAIGGYAAKTAMDFDQSATLIQTQAGATAQQMHFLRDSVLQYAQSGKSEATPNELLQGMYHLVSVGLRGQHAMDALTASQKLASVGQSDMETTASALAGVWHSNIRGAQNFNKEAGLLNAIVGHGNLRLQDMIGALGTGLVPAAKRAHLTLNDIGSALDSMTSDTVPATQAATRLRMLVSLLTAQSAGAQKALKELGIQQGDLAVSLMGGGPHGGLVSALELVHNRMSSLSQPAQLQFLHDAFGGSRSSSTIAQLLNNLDRLSSTYDTNAQKADQLNKLYIKQEHTVHGELQAAWSQMQVSLVHLGHVVLPLLVKAVRWLAQAIQNAVKWFDNLSPTMQKVVLVTLGLVAVLGPLLFLFGGTAIGASYLARAIVFLSRPIMALIGWIGGLLLSMTGLEVAMDGSTIMAATAGGAFFALDLAVLAIPLAIALLIGAFILAYNKVKWFRDGVNAVVNFFKDFWNSTLGTIILLPFKALVWAIQHFHQIKQAAIDVYNWFKGLWEGPLGQALRKPFEIMYNIAKPIFDGLKAAAEFVISKVQWLIDHIPDIPDIPGAIASVSEATVTLPKAAQQLSDSQFNRAQAYASSHGVSLAQAIKHLGFKPPSTGGGGGHHHHGGQGKIGANTTTPYRPPPRDDGGDGAMHQHISKVYIARKQIAEAVAEYAGDKKARR